MFCKRCGKELPDGSVVCNYCGASQTDIKQHEVKSNTVALVGFIFAFLMPIVGFICSIIGVTKAAECGGHRKGLAVAGIVISIIVWILGIALFII